MRFASAFVKTKKYDAASRPIITTRKSSSRIPNFMAQAPVPGVGCPRPPQLGPRSLTHRLARAARLSFDPRPRRRPPSCSSRPGPRRTSASGLMRHLDLELAHACHLFLGERVGLITRFTSVISFDWFSRLMNWATCTSLSASPVTLMYTSSCWASFLDFASRAARFCSKLLARRGRAGLLARLGFHPQLHQRHARRQVVRELRQDVAPRAPARPARRPARRAARSAAASRASAARPRSAARPSSNAASTSTNCALSPRIDRSLMMNADPIAPMTITEQRAAQRCSPGGGPCARGSPRGGSSVGSGPAEDSWRYSAISCSGSFRVVVRPRSSSFVAALDGSGLGGRDRRLGQHRAHAQAERDRPVGVRRLAGRCRRRDRPRCCGPAGPSGRRPAPATDRPRAISWQRPRWRASPPMKISAVHVERAGTSPRDTGGTGTVLRPAWRSARGTLRPRAPRPGGMRPAGRGPGRAARRRSTCPRPLRRPRPPPRRRRGRHRLMPDARSASGELGWPAGVCDSLFRRSRASSTLICNACDTARVNSSLPICTTRANRIVLPAGDVRPRGLAPMSMYSVVAPCRTCGGRRARSSPRSPAARSSCRRLRSSPARPPPAVG